MSLDGCLCLQMNAKILAIVLAASLTVSLGFALPLAINHFNDTTFGSITILNEPELLRALKDVQSRGVCICIHGWRHEDFSYVTPTQAREDVEKALGLFHEAGLVPVAFLSPYVLTSDLPPSVIAAIESTGIATSLPSLNVGEYRLGSYGWGWRDMKSFSDPRFEEEYNRIKDEQPTTIVLHVQDWNPFLMRLVYDYLEQSNESSITVRVDDIEVNTSAEKIYDLAALLDHASVGLLAYGVIPLGTWTGGNPAILGVSMNSVMGFYWLFYLITAFFPLSFSVLWRFASEIDKKNNPDEDHLSHISYRKGTPCASIIVPAYNEERNIGKCIEAIQKQDFDHEMEIIVVNDGSTDRTAEIASKYPVKLVDLKANIGKANALNTAIKSANGNILVFSDSDSQMSSNAVSSLVRCLEEREDVGAVAGNVFINKADGKNGSLTYFQMIEYRLEQEIIRCLQSASGNVLVCPGPLFATRREAAKEIMFSDKSVIEDSDFTIQVLKKGMKVVREPQARAYTNAPHSIRSWFNQRQRWWHGSLQLWKMHNPWTKRNPWMILNYSGFMTSTFSLVLMLLLPFFLSTYSNLTMILLRSVAYVVTPIVLFILFTASFFKGEKKLLAMLLPYSIVYSTMKAIVATHIYLRHLSRRGARIRFGPRTITVK